MFPTSIKISNVTDIASLLTIVYKSNLNRSTENEPRELCNIPFLKNFVCV
jgi:hypothetical protein